MLRIGLTGGIASGKSTAARILHDFGATVFDADRIVADLYGPGGEGAEAVERLFGPSFLDGSGGVSKPELAAAVFSDPGKKRALEAAIHPLVIAEIRCRLAEADRAGATVAVAEASQLLEGGYGGEFDRILLVVAPRSARLERAETRGMPRAETERRIAAQMPDEEARAKADDVVENIGTVEDLRKKVEKLYRGWTGT